MLCRLGLKYGPQARSRFAAKECLASSPILAGPRTVNFIDNRATPTETAKDESWGIYNFKVKLAYNGKAYKGWQIQNGSRSAPTIQQAFEKALFKIKSEDRRVMRVQGAGRTDAGVHANGQVVNFYSNKLTPPLHKIVPALNAHLPADIRALEVHRVPPDFSARYSSLSKVYCFKIQVGKVYDVFKHGLCQNVTYPSLDVNAMREAAQEFVGAHDFKQFSSIPALDPLPNPVKTIYKMELLEDGQDLTIRMDGSGFLYNQCRHMVGCLIQVGLGTMSAEDVSRLLKIGSSQHPGLKYRGWSLAQPQGLFLEEVRYPPHDDPEVWMYPDLPHDQFGRVWLPMLGPGEEKAMIQRMKEYRSQHVPPERCDLVSCCNFGTL